MKHKTLIALYEREDGKIIYFHDENTEDAEKFVLEILKEKYES